MAENLKIFAERSPRGKVATYGQVAATAGFPGAARQVVWALRAFRGLPWHRVVGAGGAIRVTGGQAHRAEDAVWSWRRRVSGEARAYEAASVEASDLTQLGGYQRGYQPA